jgi:hypothetical protein
MSKQIGNEKRNAFLDEYNHNLKEKVSQHEIDAKSFIPKQYQLLRQAGFGPTTAGDRLSMDLSEIWSDRTIRRYKPIESRHLEKQRKDTSKPYYEAAQVLEEMSHDAGVDYDLDLENKMNESNKHVSETLPPITRNCPSCNTVIAISSEGYHLSIYK